MTFDIRRGIGTFGRLKNADPGFGDFAVVVPMYNEASGANACVDRIGVELQKFGDRPRLIAVNDGSTDGTREILDALCVQNSRLVVIHKPVNEGYGAALRTGAERAAGLGFRYALFMDSDLTNNPADIEKFVSKMARGYDVIKASRFSAGGGMRGVPGNRAIVSRVGNTVARALFRLKIRDMTNGFRAVRLQMLLQTPFAERGFASIVEELYQCKRLGASFAEVPVTLTSRTSERRATVFAYKPSIFFRYLKYCVLAFGVRK